MFAMQKPDGLFYHFWSQKDGIDRSSMLLYASQQGVLGLAMWGRVTGDDRLATAAIKGMDNLAGPYWDFFLGKWFFGPEHWTCLAARELYPVAPKREYAAVCREIGRHFVRATLGPADTPFAEQVGGLGLAHILPPHEGGTATSAEAMAAAVSLGSAAGMDVAEVRDRLTQTYRFLARCQATIHDAFWMRRPATGVGGFFERQATPIVRIDNVQHAISSMVNGLDLFPPDPPGAIEEAMRDYQVAAQKP